MDKWIKTESLLHMEASDPSSVILRPSGISSFIRCPYQWYMVHILNKRQKPAAATSAGTSVHAGAEHGYKQKIILGELPKMSECVDVAVAIWDELNSQDEPLEYNEGETRGRYTDDIASGMEVYYQEAMKEVTPVAVEQRYSLELDHPYYTHLSGTIDIDLEDGIADIKFTKSKSTIMHYTLQQSTYGLLKVANGKPVSRLEIHNVVRPKALKTKYSPAELHIGELPLQFDYAKFWINNILDTVAQYKETKNDLLFRGCSPDSNYLCNEKWCGFWKECPYVEGYRNGTGVSPIKDIEFNI